MGNDDDKNENCGKCGNTRDFDMVMCDNCEVWFCYECVNVTDEIRNADWMCDECAVNLTLRQQDAHSAATSAANNAATAATNNSATVATTNASTAATTTNATLATIASSTLVGETGNLLMNLDQLRQYNLQQYGGQQRPGMPTSEAPVNPAALEQQLRQRQQRVDHLGRHQVGQVNNAANSRRIDLEYELKCLDERKRIELFYLKQKNELLNKYGVTNNINNNDKVSSGETDKARAVKQHCTCTNNSMCGASGVQVQNLTLRTEQINARHAVPKELPVFTGKPEEWPSFISSYENSTRLCGYSNDENLLRLQQAIKGQARETVRSLLLIPSLVPEVIDTLRKMYGRPEQIINSLLAKIRASNNINPHKLETLIAFALEVKNLVATMEACKLITHLMNPLLLSELIDKLPTSQRLEWALYARQLDHADLVSFSAWLFELATAASSIVSYGSMSAREEKKKQQRVGFHDQQNESDANKTSHAPQNKGDAKRCVMCTKNHFVAECVQFKELPHKDKWDFIKRMHLCRMCLKTHEYPQCKESKVCGINQCSFRHHRLLHKAKQVNSAKEIAEQHVAIQIPRTSKVLFKVVPITIYGPKGSLDIFALLDDGSGPTMVEKGVIDKLNLKGKKSQLCVRWTDGSVRSESNSEQLDLKVSARGKYNKQILLRDVHTVAKLDLPTQTMIFEELTNKFNHLKGIPVESYENVIPIMIIGINNKHATMPMRFREGKIDEPAATKTRIGWTVFGSINGEHGISSGNLAHFHVCECDDDVALNKLMIENMKVDTPISQGREDDSSAGAIEKYENKIERTGNHFTARLFWRFENVTLPDNFTMALKRLECFEKKLNKNPDLKMRVNALIRDMEYKQYIRPLSDRGIEEYHPHKWYLPIFSVYNPNKPHKTRLVWDAAAEYGGVSLNKCLESGPDLLRPLVGVLYNFRVGKIGICGDICEMFHRVRVHEDDQHCQRFLWRECQTDVQPQVYVLQVCSFGATCSPCIAQCVKNKNAKEHEKEYPRAAKSILERHYMDDMLDSVDSLDEAIDLVREVSLVHKCGNFEIRNWLSNSSELMQVVQGAQEQNKFCKAAQTIDQLIEPEKVLGLWWQTRDDFFMFNTKFTKASADILNGTKLPTKRELLRLIMSVFDPLGFLSFYTVRVKILLQEIWRSGIGWDDVIPKEFEKSWQDWLVIFEDIVKVKVPRCYFSELSREQSIIDLHVFVDASSEAYATVAYFRIVSGAKVVVTLVGSKTKVAPIRPLSIPRMELLGALLGARFAKSIVDCHDIQIRSVYFWTDSKTVLFWLRQNPRKFKQFVLFRISEIQEISEVTKWLYVPSKSNVADMATKIKNPINFESTNEWFSGPKFLQMPVTDWPSQEQQIEIDDISNNASVERSNHLVALQVETPKFIDYNRFSKWGHLLRSMAYVKHFINNIKIKLKNKKFGLKEPAQTMLTSDELRWAEKQLHRICQNDEYSKDIEILKIEPLSVLPKNSPLKKLSPYLDDQGVLRTKGRIENAPVDFNVKNPIILPKNHKVTKLIVDWYHRKFRHVHHETVLNEVSQKFYIGGLRRVLRSIRVDCQFCKNNSVLPVAPEMGQLPEARLSAFTRPFAHTGIDFFGPFMVTIGRRKEKRYGVMFTCLTCRAVHIEVAYSLSMNSCVIAIRNFIGRRGAPVQFYSDNGTNFVAAEKELREAYQQLDMDAIQSQFTSSDTKWTFIPPASPHMGGAWERMIRTAKNVLYKIVTPTTSLTDEKLVNLFIEVESILNSRPLTYLSLDTAEQEALTPNHFLLGSSNGHKPPGEFQSCDQFVRSSWRHSQYLAECFWKRWLAEVLPLLTRRSKWHEKAKPISIGDVVFVVDPNLPRYSWPRGIVEQTILAKDGQVRSVHVRTASGVYHRPAAKIAVLDVKSTERDDDKLMGMDSNDRHTRGQNVKNPSRIDCRLSDSFDP